MPNLHLVDISPITSTIFYSQFAFDLFSHPFRRIKSDYTAETENVLINYHHHRFGSSTIIQ